MTAYEKLSRNGIYISPDDIEKIAKKYNITEISVFGSSIRSDFSNSSDLDLLVEFAQSDQISLLDIIDIQDYFEKLTTRSVDIVEPGSLVNPYRKESILSTREPLFIDCFLRQVVYQQRIPFDIKLPRKHPVLASGLSESQLHAELNLGFEDISSGNVLSSGTVRTMYGGRDIASEL